jgi:hypothetical protein
MLGSFADGLVESVARRRTPAHAGTFGMSAGLPVQRIEFDMNQCRPLRDRSFCRHPNSRSTTTLIPNSKQHATRHGELL